jgi:hypothetical protein
MLLGWLVPVLDIHAGVEDGPCERLANREGEHHTDPLIAMKSDGDYVSWPLWFPNLPCPKQWRYPAT